MQTRNLIIDIQRLNRCTPPALRQKENTNVLFKLRDCFFLPNTGNTTASHWLWRALTFGTHGTVYSLDAAVHKLAVAAAEAPGSSGRLLIDRLNGLLAFKVSLLRNSVLICPIQWPLMASLSFRVFDRCDLLLTPPQEAS